MKNKKLELNQIRSTQQLSIVQQSQIKGGAQDQDDIIIVDVDIL